MKHELTIDMEVKLTVEVCYDITKEWSADERGVFFAGFTPEITRAVVASIQFPNHCGSTGMTIHLPYGEPCGAVKHYVEQHCFEELFSAWSKQES